MSNVMKTEDYGMLKLKAGKLISKEDET